MTAVVLGKRTRTLHRSLVRDGLMVASGVYLIWVWQYLMATGSHVDAVAYWHAASGNPYTVSHAGAENAFLYSPVVAQLLAPVAAVPISVFVGALLAASLAALIFLVGPTIAAVALLTPLPVVWQDLSSGNIHILLTAAIILGFRYPTAWALVLLTKVTPGVGLLWFAVRRDWRALRFALGFTLILTAGSFALAPTLWGHWVDVLRANSSVAPGGLFVPAPLWLRLFFAAALVWWGARNNHAWTVPLAAMLALPVIWIYDGFAMLLGVVSVLRHHPRSANAANDAPSDG